MTKDKVVEIWWRVLQPGEFYNIERRKGSVPGGGGALYIEIPKSLVRLTLGFFDYEGSEVDEGGFTISAATIGKIGHVAPVNFQVKAGGRLRIANQNRQAESNSRHPAWSAQNEFPRAPDDVQSTQHAMQYLPEGGVRIFIAKTGEGEYLAGFTKGGRPENIPLSSPIRALYVNSGVGGVLTGLNLPLAKGGPDRVP